MQVVVSASGGTTRIVVNGYTPVIDYHFRGRDSGRARDVKTGCGTLGFEENGPGLTVRKDLETFEHVVGFGEKAFELERKRLILRMWNNDPGGYRRGDDPIYLSIPFYISIREKATGFFVNSVSGITFDVGVSEYDRIIVRIPETGLEMYVFEGDTVQEVLEQFLRLTGMPFMPPEWSLGHQVSRFSYYPENTVMGVAEEYSRIVPVSAIYLDIDYMDSFKIFTWNKRIFGDPSGMIESLHRKGVRSVAIMDPGLKAEQGYNHFEEGMGSYVETSNQELYLGRVWPGLCAFPDFFDERAVRHWKGMVRSFIKENGVDGLWLDMNEPSVFNEGKTIPGDAVHNVGGRKIRHDVVHNAYGLLEARATFEAMSDVIPEPYILSRSGFAGIQKYAAVWTGDNISSWDDLRLQIPMVTSMGISGVPFAGCDLGGFAGRTEPELVARYYQMAAFFPVYRNHKSKDGSDQELFLLPERYRKMAVEAVLMRYSYMPYLYSLAWEAHAKGHPVVRPLFYSFQNDRTSYSVNDEYMVGDGLLYAPVLDRGAEGRDVYLPEGEWFSLDDGRVHKGQQWFRKEGTMNLFVRKGSIIPMSGNRFLVYGSGKFLKYDGEEHRLSSGKDSFDAGSVLGKCTVTFLGTEKETAATDGKKCVASRETGRTTVGPASFRRVVLE